MRCHPSPRRYSDDLGRQPSDSGSSEIQSRDAPCGSSRPSGSNLSAPPWRHEQLSSGRYVVIRSRSKNRRGSLRIVQILLIEGRNYSPSKFIEQIKMDFDQLYDEAAHRRRMMSVSAHDRISGSPQMVRAWNEFCTTPRGNPEWRFYARTRSPGMRWKASLLYERARPSDLSSVATFANTKAAITRSASVHALGSDASWCALLAA